jgi:glycine/D-amino acid oxidase-like deaminating enzyme
MMTTRKAVTYEWIVIGGGIAGIAVSEILTREGHSVLLLDKEEKLANETTKEFHEWIHTGCLYTLVPDKLLTLKYIVGGIDDLLEYYSAFERMNLMPTECGLEINGAGWFIPNYIHFKYKRRPFNPFWSYINARSKYLIDRIATHDWLRRRAGIVDEFKADQYRSILRNLREIWRHPGEFLSLKTTDFTSNSRVLLRDLVATSLKNGLEIALKHPVREIRNHRGVKIVTTDQAVFTAEKVVLCTGKNIADFTDVKVKTSYAPLAVVKGLDETAYSFVELDYYVKSCINLLVKESGIGLIGGISLSKRSDCDPYLDYVIGKHKKYQPTLRELGRYIGLKNEITFPNQDRNYLFHIVNCGHNLWATIPGKFTLGFSLAPEFYRRIYHKNPRKYFQTVIDTGQVTALVAATKWQEMQSQWSTQEANSNCLKRICG